MKSVTVALSILTLVTFRRANISWRQQVGCSSIEASKIVGHSKLEMISDYTIVSPERQNELTRLIQERIVSANKSKSPEARNSASHRPKAKGIS
jgi:hypothetical protein